MEHHQDQHQDQKEDISISDILLKYDNNYRLIIADANEITLNQITIDTALTISQPVSYAIEPLIYNIWFREHEENSALIDKNWSPKVQEIFNDDNSQKRLTTLFKEYYAFKALKRIYLLKLEHKLPFNLTAKGLELMEDYHKVINILSTHCCAHEFAGYLVTTFNRITNLATEANVDRLYTENKYVITTDTFMQTLAPVLYQPTSLHSLLFNIITHAYNRNMTKMESSIYSISLYFDTPKSSSDFRNLLTQKNINSDFTNLLYSAHLIILLKYLSYELTHSNAEEYTSLCKDALGKFKVAYQIYIDHNDNLPLITCLSRDLSSIIQKEYINNQTHNFNQTTSKTLYQLVNNESNIINPNYAKDRAYQENCASCVTAYELNIRGFAVEALPKLVSSSDDAVNILSNHINLLWQNRITKAAPDIIPIESIDDIDKVCYFGERYHLMIDYAVKNTNQGNSHIVAFERYQHNTDTKYQKHQDKTVIYDAQSNQLYSIYEYFETLKNVSITAMSYYRVDDCDPVFYFINQIVKSADPNNSWHHDNLVHNL